MEKITLKLHEIYKLDSEINGIVNKQTGQKVSNGLLGEKLLLTTKYWISDLSKKVAADKAIVDDLREELIKKFGTKKETGEIYVPIYVEDESSDKEGRKTFNPNFLTIEKEVNTLLQTEKELEYHPFKLEDFSSVETSEDYDIFFKLIQA